MKVGDVLQAQEKLVRSWQDISIVFLADRRRFGYHLLGGTESYVRRLATALGKMGTNVRYVLFNADAYVAEVDHNCILHECRSQRDALKAIQESGATDVVTVSIGPIEELRYACFRKKQAKRIKFHRILFTEQAAGLKKLLLSTADKIAPYNGAELALTQRAMDLPGRRRYLLRPPVPDGFYVSPADKPLGGPLKVVFVGRLDPEKGINEVLELFDRLAGREDIDLTIHGYTWGGLRESEEIDERLQAQHRVRYVAASHEGFSAGSEAAMADIFRAADVIVLPYKRFDRTIDPPLILLEAMASLCIPLTRPVGAVPEVAPDEWLCDGDDFIAWAEEKINYLADNLAGARNELAAWNDQNGVRASRAAAVFLQAIRQE